VSCSIIDGDKKNPTFDDEYLVRWYTAPMDNDITYEPVGERDRVSTYLAQIRDRALHLTRNW
jgi:hypothetical protein